MNEAEVLFTEVLQCDRAALYVNRNSFLNQDSLGVIASVLRKRIGGQPLHYILGKSEFLGLEFKVAQAVLIPRPETEILVEAALAQGVRVSGCQGSGLHILDMGTGSGCIAVSLAKLLPCAQVTAVDISSEALEIAKENARMHTVAIRFIRSDLFSSYQLPVTSYDIIVSNPPYIPSAEITYLSPEVKSEPALALDGGEDGLKFYRAIIERAPGFLRKNGFLIIEMGFGQKDAIVDIFDKHAAFTVKEIVRDYSDIERVVVAQKNA